jgi:hypothetical protein
VQEIAAIPFHDFVEQSLKTLRAAAVYTLRVAHPLSVTTDVFFFFVASCWNKIQHRARTVLDLYPLESLAWTPALSEMNILPTKIAIHGEITRLVLLRVEVPSQQNEFEFNGSVAGRWWKALLILLKQLFTCSLGELSQRSVAAYVGLSSTTHRLLESMPTTFWAIPSLSVHLKKVRKGKGDRLNEFREPNSMSVVTPTPTTVPLPETEEGENEEEDMLTAGKLYYQHAVPPLIFIYLYFI